METSSEELHPLHVLVTHLVLEVSDAMVPLQDEPGVDDGSPPWKRHGLGPFGLVGVHAVGEGLNV